MSFLEIFNAAFINSKPATSSNTEIRGAVSQTAKASGAKNNISFGIKAKAPLKADTFEKQEQMVSYKGQKMTREKAKETSYNDVYKHEAAHLAAAGKYATTGICIEYGQDGIAKGGHVGIAMPVLDKKDPKKTIEHAETVIKAAEAPASFDELSGADMNVAAAARAVKAKALNLLA